MEGFNGPQAFSGWPDTEPDTLPSELVALPILAPPGVGRSSLPSDEAHLDSAAGFSFPPISQLEYHSITSFPSHPSAFLGGHQGLSNMLPPAQRRRLSVPSFEALVPPSGAYLDFPPVSPDMGRAASLPADLGQPAESASLLQQKLQPPTPCPSPGRPGFRERLLHAMPMSRSASFTAGKATDVAALQKARPHVDPDSEATHRLKNRDAQRRFRQRQRESISEAQRAVQELARKLEDLDWDVQQERLHAQAMMDTLLLENIHIKRLAAFKEVQAAVQQTTLQSFQELVSCTGGKGSAKKINRWTVKDWVDWYEIEYIPQLKMLLREQDTDAAAAQRLKSFVSLWRDNTAQIARFSSWNWILYGWNVEALQKLPADKQPGLTHSLSLLASLKLSKAQEDTLLTAHQRLRRQFNLAAAEKAAVQEALDAHQGSLAGGKSEAQVPEGACSEGSTCDTWETFDSLECSSMGQYGGFKVEGVDWGPAGSALRALRRFLEGQRWAVYSFFFTILDLTLTLEQEATLESLASPFLPDWHTMLCALALQRQAAEVTTAEIGRMALPDLSFDGPMAEQLRPVVTPAELLLRPMMSLGIGLRLAYGLLLSPFHTVDDASLWELQPQSAYSSLQIFAAAAGSWQTGLGAPLYWFGLSTEDQIPSALEQHEKAGLRTRQALNWGASESL